MNASLTPHSPRWRHEFDEEAVWLRSVFSSSLAEVHHVGSTSIPGMPSMPVIDILVEVNSLKGIAKTVPALKKLGYHPHDEEGVHERKLFTKSDDRAKRYCQIYVVESGSPGAERLLAFRDYLLAHQDEARAYGKAKKDAEKDPASYAAAKDAFVDATLSRAIAWKYGKI